MSESYLVHHGIKGMKWGIRRYQNYDGSYTQAGLKRVRSSMDEYERKEQKYKDTKAAYKQAKKSGEDTFGYKTKVTNARMRRNEAKTKLEKDYKHLKKDKAADQGKELYSKGVRVRENAKVVKALSTIGSLSLTAAAYDYRSGGKITSFVNDLLGATADVPVTNILAGVAVGALAGSAGVKVASEIPNNKLREYYSHTSNY